VNLFLSVLSNFTGWIALGITGWREWCDHTRVRFRFDVGELELDDPEIGPSLWKAVDVTVTNMGARPISMDRIVCSAVCKGPDGPEERQLTERLNRVKAARGEPAHHSLLLPGDPTEFRSVQAFDTAGRIWKANKKALKQLNAVGR
jgi:hypothetical protein